MIIAKYQISFIIRMNKEKLVITLILGECLALMLMKIHKILSKLFHHTPDGCCNHHSTSIATHKYCLRFSKKKKNFSPIFSVSITINYHQKCCVVFYNGKTWIYQHCTLYRYHPYRCWSVFMHMSHLTRLILFILFDFLAWIGYMYV